MVFNFMDENIRVRKFLAPDARSAMNMVREELGSDAIILSNNRVKDGVEIVTAITNNERIPDKYEYPNRRILNSMNMVVNRDGKDNLSRYGEGYIDSRGQDNAIESMGEEIKSLKNILNRSFRRLTKENYTRNYPNKSLIYDRLKDIGLSKYLCKIISDQVDESEDIRKVWHQSLAILAQKIPTLDIEENPKKRIIALIGPTGVGKTTTAAKLAARFSSNNKKRNIGLITTDNCRVGAYEQLQAYGRMLDIPVKPVANSEELKNSIDDFYDKDFIIIDTAGMSQRDIRVANQLQLLRDIHSPIETYLLVDASTCYIKVEEILKSYCGINISGAIITKMDEATSVGGCISSAIKHNIPLLYMANGQVISEDIMLVKGHEIVAQGVTLLKQLGRLINDDPLDDSENRMSANAII